MSKLINSAILECHICGADKLQPNRNKLICASCKHVYPIIGNQYIFSETGTSYPLSNSLDRLKFRFKQYAEFYDLLVRICSPIYFNDGIKKFIKQYIKEGSVAINLGSGNTNYDNISNIDIIPYPNVNLVCDIQRVPIKSNSVDVLINSAVLEHVCSDTKIVTEMRRILKKGGVLYCLYPFIQGYHASPGDYTRRTQDGIKELFKEFEIVELRNFGGPTSGLLWIFQEWIAIAFSFGIQPLHDIVYLIVMLITFPIKYLDIILIHNKYAKYISSGFIFVGKKNNLWT